MTEPLTWPTDLGDPPWLGVLDEECSKPEFLQFLHGHVGGPGIYPDGSEVFAAFRRTPFDNVRVVIVGQDPYPTPGLATGLAFSVPRDHRPLPASLHNIQAAMLWDGLTPPDHGDLTGWADQGVLLLNTALTVPRGAPGSHLRAWRPFTKAVIQLLNKRGEPIVFVLWGAKAERFKRLIVSPQARVVDAPHPASRGAYQRGFRESETFSRVNRELTVLGQGEIDWEID